MRGEETLYNWMMTLGIASIAMVFVYFHRHRHPQYGTITIPSHVQISVSFTGLGDIRSSKCSSWLNLQARYLSYTASHMLADCDISWPWPAIAKSSCNSTESKDARRGICNSIQGHGNDYGPPCSLLSLCCESGGILIKFS